MILAPLSNYQKRDTMGITNNDPNKTTNLWYDLRGPGGAMLLDILVTETWIPWLFILLKGKIKTNRVIHLNNLLLIWGSGLPIHMLAVPPILLG